MFAFVYRELSRLAERPPASCSLLLKDGDSLRPPRQHLRLARLCRFRPGGKSVEVQLQRSCSHRQPHEAREPGFTQRSGDGLTEEVVWRQRLEVPDLQDEDGGELLLGFIQREDVVPLPHHHHLWQEDVLTLPSSFPRADVSRALPSLQACSWRGTPGASWSSLLRSGSCSERPSPGGRPPNLSANCREATFLLLLWTFIVVFR